MTEYRMYYMATLSTTGLLNLFGLLTKAGTDDNRVMREVVAQLRAEGERRDHNAGPGEPVEAACLAVPDDLTVAEIMDGLKAANLHASIAAEPAARQLFFVLAAGLLARLGRALDAADMLIEVVR